MSVPLGPSKNHDAGRILITGGSGSGKSAYAEGLFGADERVTYIAPGAVPDPASDAEWAARVAAHQLRRPAHWRTVETADLMTALRTQPPPVLLDCLGTWLARYLDDLNGWERPRPQWQGDFDDHLATLVEAWRDVSGRAVAVTNEVGWGLVSEHRSGRLFTELLGRVNTAMAAASDEVILVVAGRAIRI
jgi:adenosylcobinamide kinase / adenosylcobinamide-phosphate guanylyltransferase